MIKILIIEDEIPARKKLKKFIDELQKNTLIVDEFDNTIDAKNFLKNNSIDLIFSDIELRDGNAFEIYTELEISCPIIFITAYDAFLMDAFESYGIDYLLKPFTKERFIKSWNKFLLFHQKEENDLVMNLKNLIETKYNQTKTRFSIQTNSETYFLETADIVYFEADEGIIVAYDEFYKKHLINESTLKEIEEKIDKNAFFRINRSQIVQKKYIEKISRYSKHNLALKLSNTEKYLITSQSNTSTFREWIEK